MNVAGLPTAVIFRLQMFKPSEPFIAAQAGALRTFAPVFLGRERFGPPPVAAGRAVQDRVGRRSWAILRHAATRDPAVFLAALGGVRPALIHAHFGPDAVYALPLARRLGVPLVTTFHGFDVTTSAAALLRSGSPYLINYVLYRKQLSEYGALFLCVSEHIRQKAFALGFPETSTRLHYIGIDPAMGNTAADCASMNILHVARMVEKKGTAILIRAFAAVQARHPSATLTIIGDGPLRATLEALATKMNVAGSVAFLGALPNAAVLNHMRKAAMFVLPSVTAASGDTEGLPITILEACALGLPVVATRHGGIPEAVRDGETGLLVPERDEAALAAAIDHLLGDRAERSRLGAAARDFVRQHFNLQRQTAGLEAQYAVLVA